MATSLQDIREAYTLAGGASALTPKIIDRLLSELVRKYAPLRRAIPRKTWESDVFYFNRRTALPKAQATTEAPSTTDVTASNSTYNQISFAVKHLQSQLDISTFAAKVATVNGNLFDLELAAASKAMAWLEEILHIWGSANATLNTKRPEWDGLDLLIASGNKIDAGTQTLTLSMLDNMIDAVKTVFASELGTDYFFMMSPKMQSKANSLFTNQQRFNAGMTKIFSRDDFGDPGSAVADNYIDGGVELATYRGVPIVLSNFMSSQGSMTTVSTTGNTGSGSSLLAATTYYYVVEAVTRYGLTTASAEVSQAPAANGNNVVLTWTTPTPTDVYGNTIDVLAYRIFRGTASGGESLYAIVSAYDNSDSAVTTFTDTGLVQDPTANSALYATTVAKSGGNAVPDGVTFPRIQTTGQNVEDIYLIPRNPEFLVAPVVNDLTTTMLAPVNARTRQFALIEDMTLAMRAPAFAAKLSRVRSV